MPKLNQGISTPIAIVIIIVLAVILVGGVLAYQYWWAPEEPGPAATISPTPTPTPDETADWKIYRNEEYGFEIKYPATFDSTGLTLIFEKHSPPPGTIGGLIINGKTAAYIGSIFPLYLSFSIFPTTINDLEKYVKDKVATDIAFHEKRNEEYPSDPIKFNCTYSKITMGNTIGYAIRSEFLDSGQENTEIFIQNSKTLIRILYGSSDSEKVKVIQKILSTFRFIE